MGTNHYLVSPKLKAIFWLGGSSFNEDMLETTERKIDLQQRRFDEEEPVDTFEWTIDNIKKKKLRDMMNVVSFYDDLAWIIAEGCFWAYVFAIKMQRYDKEAYIITDYDERFKELRKEGYKMIDE